MGRACRHWLAACRTLRTATSAGGTPAAVVPERYIPTFADFSTNELGKLGPQSFGKQMDARFGSGVALSACTDSLDTKSSGLLHGETLASFQAMQSRSLDD